MRALRYLVVVPALALLVTACGPHHRRHHGPDDPHHRGGHHAGMMGHHGGHGACSYKSNWFSEGAVRSNDGVCQACSAGKWVAAEGCHAHDCGKGCDHGDCQGRKGKKPAPCHHDGRGYGHPHKHPHQNH